MLSHLLIYLIFTRALWVEAHLLFHFLWEIKALRLQVKHVNSHSLLMCDPDTPSILFTWPEVYNKVLSCSQNTSHDLSPNHSNTETRSVPAKGGEAVRFFLVSSWTHTQSLSFRQTSSGLLPRIKRRLYYDSGNFPVTGRITRWSHLNNCYY